MINFDNTEIAFASKSNKDLKRAYWLFKMIGNSVLVNLGKRLTNIALTLSLPIKGIIKNTIFKQFCGGETISDSSETIEQLAVHNVKTILDIQLKVKNLLMTLKQQHQRSSLQLRLEQKIQIFHSQFLK